jgi:hypothetical protein
MTVQTLMQSALYAFGQTPDNVRFADDFYGAVNDSQNDIANSRKWGFLRTSGTLTTVDGTRTVALPSDFGTFFDIPGAMVITAPAGSLGTVITLMTQEEWQSNLYDDGSEEGTPTYAYVLGSSLYLSPIPDAAYTVAILYYKRPADIADTSSTLTVPAAYSELLKKMVWRRLQDSGYASIQEIQISDNDIQRLMGVAARNDIAQFGGMTMNLNSTTYKRRTV